MKHKDQMFRMRAWDSVNHKMHYNYQRIYIESGDEDDIPSGVVFNSDIHKHDFSKWPPEYSTTTYLIEMQWVHAVDEMNMPIYEADLIEVEKDDSRWLGIVWWGSRGSALCWDTTKVKDGKLFNYIYFDEKEKFTIVGNLYENKEMVEDLISSGVIKY